MSNFLSTNMTGVGIEEFLTNQNAIVPTWSFDWAHSPTPKDVLRLTIEANRKRKGQELPTIEKFSVIRRRPKQLRTGEVSEEILKRREKNRQAARKCRMKKRKILDTLQEKVDKYESRNKNAEREIEGLENEITKLKSLLHGHRCQKHPPKPTYVRQHWEPQENSSSECLDANDGDDFTAQFEAALQVNRLQEDYNTESIEDFLRDIQELDL